jgi:hypothetical protein
MTGDNDHTSIPVSTGDETIETEPFVQAAFPTREDALALALKIAGPKLPDESAAL